MSYILLSSFSAYALEQTVVKEQIPVSIIDMTSTDQDGIVKNALICSLSAEKDLDQMSQIWSNIKEIYADRDEGNLMLEAIEETEYLEKYLL
jgi:hypothetical protein